MKRFIVETLDLENIRPEDIGDDMSLFKDGLGLDSIDAFEFGDRFTQEIQSAGEWRRPRRFVIIFVRLLFCLAFLNSQIESPA